MTPRRFVPIKSFSTTITFLVLFSTFEKTEGNLIIPKIGSEYYDACVYGILKKSIRSNTLLIPINRELENNSFLDRGRYSQYIYGAYTTITYEMNDSINRIIKRNLRYRQMHFVEFETISGLRATFNITPGGRIWKEEVKFLFSSQRFFDDVSTILPEIITFLTFEKIFNFVVMLPATDKGNMSEFNLYSWDPFEGGKCNTNSSSWYVQDICYIGGLVPRKSLLSRRAPEKYNECIIRVTPLHRPPFVMQSESSNSTVHYTGIEINSIELVADILNAEIKYISIPNTGTWGNIYSNGSATGIFKMLLDETIDIGVGAYGVSLNGLVYLDLTIPYIQDKITWCVPQVELFPDWTILRDLVESNIIFIAVMTFIAYSGLFFAMSIYTSGKINPVESIFMIFAITIGEPIRKMPLARNMRIMVMFWVWFSMYMIMFFQSSLTSAITNKRPQRQIETIDEIFERGYEIDIFGKYEVFFSDQSDYRSRKINQEKRECKDFDACFRNIAVSKKSAMVVSRTFYEYVKHRFLDRNSKPLIHCFRNNIASYSLHMVQKKKYYLRDSIDRAIRSISAAGFIDFWMNRIKFSIELKKQKYCSQENRFTMEDLTITSTVLMIGHLLSIVAFISELLYFKCRYFKKNKIHL